jgi:hypothetical protein
MRELFDWLLAESSADYDLHYFSNATLVWRDGQIGAFSGLLVGQ